MRDYLCSKFQQNWTIFGDKWAQKNPKRGMDSALLQKYLKIYNLTITDATLMKLTTIMYL